MLRYVYLHTILYILAISTLSAVAFSAHATTHQSTSTVILTATVSIPDDDPPPGGGGTPPPVTPTEVSFAGTAFPSGNIIILKDTVGFSTTSARVDSVFNVLKSNQTPGTYNFSIYGVDVYGTRSDTQTYSITLVSGARTEVSNIVIPPTSKASDTVVEPGEVVTIFGQAIQDSTVVLEFSGVGTTSTTSVQSVTNGQYEYLFDTTDLAAGDYTVRVKVVNNLIESAYSDGIVITIGSGDEPPPDSFLIADVNYDDTVDIVDFSIAAFWYKQTLSAAFAVVENERLNGDGVVDLRDFSLMAYYWTG